MSEENQSEGSLADLLMELRLHLPGIRLSHILAKPAPGTATVADLERVRRFLGDGVKLIAGVLVRTDVEEKDPT
jgi:hypothetical protein